MHNTRIRKQFETEILVHLEQAYNLARWLLRDPVEAEDIVQQSCIRAYKAFGRYRGENPVGWLLTIVRNTSYSYLQQKKKHQNLVSFDEAVHAYAEDGDVTSCHISLDPEQLNEISAKQGLVRSAINKLSTEYRETIYLREIAGYSYKEIAIIVELPIGTVMSRLSRARCQLRKILVNNKQQESPNAL
jgi:RNA polymerase sigma-70 factor (ECF subfamily)